MPVAAHRHVVVAHPEGQVRARHRAVSAGNLGKGVMGAFVDEVAVDPDERLAFAPRAVRHGDHVPIPELVEKGLRSAHGHPPGPRRRRRALKTLAFARPFSITIISRPHCPS